MGKTGRNEIEKIGRVSSESVRKHTGRGWSEWVALLDAAGARDWPHRELTVLLKKKYRLTPWWQQGVAMGYEIHHGRRVEGKSARGLYSLTATKTVPLAQKDAWRLLASDAGLAVWLAPFAPFPFEKGRAFEVDGGVFGEVRTVKAPMRLRLGWQEDSWAKPSVVQVGVHPRKGDKCLVTIQHEGVPAEAARDKLRARWEDALTRFAVLAAAPSAGGGQPRSGRRSAR